MMIKPMGQLNMNLSPSNMLVYFFSLFLKLLIIIQSAVYEEPPFYASVLNNALMINTRLIENFLRNR